MCCQPPDVEEQNIYLQTELARLRERVDTGPGWRRAFDAQLQAAENENAKLREALRHIHQEGCVSDAVIAGNALGKEQQ